MTRERIFDCLTTIFHEVFDDDRIVISDSTTASDVVEWDSLGHLNLIVAIEGEFKTKFTVEEVVSMQNVGDIVNLLEARVRK